MKIEVLVATMHQKNLALAKKMNIKTDAIIINQCDGHSYQEERYKDTCIKMYSFAERGVGKSRNNALMRSTADICVMADDDVVYLDDYEEIVRAAFQRNPKADMIMFNVPSANKERDNIKIKKNCRVRFYNCLKYGTFNIAFRREAVLKANVYFSLLFGGGAAYGAGEDSLFIAECLDRGLVIYTDTSKIADVYHDTSTWFKGFNEKYFFDKGAFFAALSPGLARLLILQFAVRRHDLYKMSISFTNACKAMTRGMRQFSQAKNVK
ncbi:glycosyltransferase [Azotosporobacter soli]|uniref:glycosyltransferase n=1 Tax=Azotosporobacter soli TaxID=3055040 RepID=UPI0031FE94C5